MPAQLVTVEALADAARVAPLALVNIVDNRSGRARARIAAALAGAYRRVWALGGRSGNTVLVGDGGGIGLARIAAAAAADPSPASLTAPAEIARLAAACAATHDSAAPDINRGSFLTGADRGERQNLSDHREDV